MLTIEVASVAMIFTSLVMHGTVRGRHTLERRAATMRVVKE